MKDFDTLIEFNARRGRTDFSTTSKAHTHCNK